jgi:hypothetical protein
VGEAAVLVYGDVTASSALADPTDVENSKVYSGIKFDRVNVRKFLHPEAVSSEWVALHEKPESIKIVPQEDTLLIVPLTKSNKRIQAIK